MRRAVWRQGAIGAAVLAPFLGVLLYLAWRSPEPALKPAPDPAPAQPGTPAQQQAQPPADAAPKGHTPADFERMAEDLKTRLAKHPDDIDDWVLLGRSLASVERWQEARDAFLKALALRPAEPLLHVQLGEVLTLQAQGRVTPEASAEFAHAPDDPRSRYYGALALAQAGDTSQAKAKLTALLADAPAKAGWRQMVQDELQSLSTAPAPDAATAQHPGVVPPAESATAAKPSEPAAVPALPGSSEAIARLESRVKSEPQDAEAWLALSRAYRAAGDRARAAGVLARANNQIRGNIDILLAYAAVLSDGIKGESLPPEFVGLMRQVEAIDPDQPDALWYLGMDAKARGDIHAAAAHWQRLLSHLPKDSDEYAAVQRLLSSLR